MKIDITDVAHLSELIYVSGTEITKSAYDFLVSMRKLTNKKGAITLSQRQADFFADLKTQATQELLAKRLGKSKQDGERAEAAQALIEKQISD